MAPSVVYLRQVTSKTHNGCDPTLQCNRVPLPDVFGTPLMCSTPGHRFIACIAHHLNTTNMSQIEFLWALSLGCTPGSGMSSAMSPSGLVVVAASTALSASSFL